MMDVGAGTFLSNLIMFFIILTAALTLHRQGTTDIETSKQAAEALRPLAGNFAAGLYALAIVAVGLLAIPTLAGSAGYAFSRKLQLAARARSKTFPSHGVLCGHSAFGRVWRLHGLRRHKSDAISVLVSPSSMACWRRFCFSVSCLLPVMRRL